jgi:hypothetical protein
MGGLMKEFLESVVAEGFDPNRGLFSATPDGCAYPNPLAGEGPRGLKPQQATLLLLSSAFISPALLLRSLHAVLGLPPSTSPSPTLIQLARPPVQPPPPHPPHPP